MQFDSWLAFCSIALLATATPGPAAMLVSITSVSFGFYKSLAVILGNVLGLLIMSGFSILGLSTVVMQSALFFTVVKVLGALYLIFLGVKLWRNGLGQMDTNKLSSQNNHFIYLFLQGVLVAITNPKAILFTTALFPQFISITEPLLPQFVMLVLSFMLLSFLCLSGYSWFAQRVSLNNQINVSKNVLGKVFGTGFIGVGCFLVTTTR